VSAGATQAGDTPLHCAVFGRASVVTLLLERGADKEAKNNVRSRNAPRTRAQHMVAHITARCSVL
jgi:hypothetical protein